MERDDSKVRQKRLLHELSMIPKKILSLHGRENVTEFVLHDLSHKSCFNLNKAAYFVNNPDFNCLKGVAGISTQEIPQGLWQNIWDQNEMFSTYMRNSPFNRKVRNFSQCSLECSLEGENAPHNEVIESVSRKLGIENPDYFSLDMKHGNHGLFVFEKNDLQDKGLKEHLLNGVSLLGFCPIF
ncbi:hypothetical protein ACFLYU_01325 [Candidatus Dependentiae bacterium]